jgi:cytochrome c biogenesis protein CcdA
LTVGVHGPLSEHDTRPLVVAAALLAGVLSTLSPCVLPLLPIVLGAAVGEHRLGPAALAAGLAVSFVTVGLFIATIGFAIGLDAGIFRTVAAILLILIGAVLIMPQFQARVALAKAVEIAKTKPPKLESGDLTDDWKHWLISQILLREAQTLIGGGSAVSGPAK